MSVLEVNGLRKTYVTRSESLTVLRDVCFTLEASRTAVIAGESGSGKTTLLNLIGGLDHASAGSIVVAGREISALAEEELEWFRNRYVGFIFQFHYLLKDFTALENVMMPAHISGIPRREASSRAHTLLADVGLEARAHHHPFELSGGERQRVAVARALMNDPRLILADEPTGNLDERNSDIVAELLFGIVHRYGKAMVLVTHQASLRDRGDDHLTLESGVIRPS